MPATKAFSKNTSKKSTKAASRKASLQKAREARHKNNDTTPVGPTSFSTPEPSKNSTDTPSLSASARKLSYFSSSNSCAIDSESLGTTIVQLDSLQGLFQNVLCGECLEPSLSLRMNPKKNFGLSVFLEVACLKCDKTLSSAYTSAKVDSVFDINRRCVAASLATGQGQAGLATFSEYMDMPVLHNKTYQTHLKHIHTKSIKHSADMLTSSVQRVREAYPEQRGKDIIDIDVSYDGSWHTRGHKSNSGVGCIIDNRTGLCIDYQVLSKYCHTCALTGKKLESTESYGEFWARHQQECEKNHFGSSGSMEQKAAVMMWNRSIEKNNLRYRTVISDGDTNTIKEINKADPYGGMTIEKQECINHVAKRLGTALRKTVENKKKVKITLGGHGNGKLTQNKIETLQTYYTRAIRSNNTVKDMKTAIWASLKHCASTDTKPQHENCPEGKDSWCFFQKAKAMGKIPPSHEKHRSTFLSDFVLDHIKDVYVRLSDEDLLKRCLEGKTQNVNECIHSVIWSKCPKHIFVGKKRLEIAMCISVGQFNQGSMAARNFLTSLGLHSGIQTHRLGRLRDSIRKRKAEKQLESVAKKRREQRKQAQKQAEEELVNLEGGRQYSAGGFE